MPQQKADTVKEFDFTRRDFERVRALIYQRAGISLADSKQEMVYSRLARRLRATGIQSFGRYLDDLEANYRKVAGISGATIMGDGGVALILDVAALVRSSRQLADDPVVLQQS